MTPQGDRHRGDDRPGVRIGPMVFVPELTTSPTDPWAHRKGEPRLFTLLWAIYLMIGAMATIFATRTLGAPTPAAYRAGCLAMITVVAAGATILWPLTRLSQRSPKGASLAVMVDLVVILLPIQAVVLPMPLLTRWPWEVTLAMSLVVSSWTLLIGGVIALGIDRPPGVHRAVLMALICALVLGGPGLALFGPGAGWPGMQTAMLASPVTAHWALTGAPPNLKPAMSASEWAMVLLPLVTAGAVWAWVGIGAFHRRRS